MQENKLELRMYGLVPYQLMGIQQGIQYGHATDEFALKVIKSLLGKNNEISKDEIEKYVEWLEFWKTYIILNGGTTNINPERLGTLNQHLETLINNNIEVSTFYEPDLGDQLTAITFIVDERVFNKLKYPEPMCFRDEDPMEGQFDSYEDWVKFIGGPKNLFLREFLSQFRLA